MDRVRYARGPAAAVDRITKRKKDRHRKHHVFECLHCSKRFSRSGFYSHKCGGTLTGESEEDAAVVDVTPILDEDVDWTDVEDSYAEVSMIFIHY